jgi:hypothetical protein
MLRSLLTYARDEIVRALGGIPRDRYASAVSACETSTATAEVLAAAIDDAVAMAYDADGRCRDCCRGIGRGHADHCGLAAVLAPLVGTARAVVDRQHERAVEIARAGRAEAQA